MSPRPLSRRVVHEVKPLGEVGAGEGEDDGALALLEAVELLAHAEDVGDAVELLTHGRVAFSSELVELEPC